MAEAKKTTGATEGKASAKVEEIVAETTATEKPQTEATETKAESQAAKAGKRSEKAQKEVAEKLAKEERKAKGDTTPQEDTEAKVAKKQNPTRTRLERRGKNYRKAAEAIEKGKAYSLK